MIDIAEKVKNIDVTNLMTKRVITVSDDQPLQEASKLMYQNNIGSIIILKSNDETGSESTPIGIVTEKRYCPNSGIRIDIFSYDANIRSNEQTIIDDNYEFLVKRSCRFDATK